jgi:hypothetical protein
MYLHLQLSVSCHPKSLCHFDKFFSHSDLNTIRYYMIIESPLRQIVSPYSSISDWLLQPHQLLARSFQKLFWSPNLQSKVISPSEHLKFKLVIFTHSQYMLPVVHYFVFDFYACWVEIFFQQHPYLLNLIKPLLVRHMGLLSHITTSDSKFFYHERRLSLLFIPWAATTICRLKLRYF